MAWRGSLSRSLMSTARASGFRSSPPLSAPSRLRHSPVSIPRVQSRRLSFSNPRYLNFTLDQARKVLKVPDPGQ